MPTISSTDDHESTEVKAIRTETSLGRVIYHAIKYSELPSADPRRDASLEASCALLGHVLRPSLAKVGGGLLAFLGVWIAWQTWQTADRQAELLARQDELIETQNAIADATRRGGERADLTDILHELKTREETVDKTAVSPIFERRVIRLTNSFTPYVGVMTYAKSEGTGLKPVTTTRDRPTSPERAALLLALLNAGALTDNIRHDGNFTFADFADATLRDADFRRLNLQWSDFRGAVIQDCTFIGAQLDDADFSSYPRYDRSRVVRPSGKADPLTLIVRCDLGSTTLGRINFNQTSFVLCSFDSATAIYGHFEGAVMSLCRLEGSKFVDCNLNGSTINNSVVPDFINYAPTSNDSKEAFQSDLMFIDLTPQSWTNCSYDRTIFNTVWVSDADWIRRLPDALRQRLKISKAAKVSPDFSWLDREAYKNSWLAEAGSLYDQAPKGWPYIVEEKDNLVQDFGTAAGSHR
jgi:uncharacterized protein YjbI with pentapeptide repeats